MGERTSREISWFFASFPKSRVPWGFLGKPLASAPLFDQLLKNTTFSRCSPLTFFGCGNIDVTILGGFCSQIWFLWENWGAPWFIILVVLLSYRLPLKYLVLFFLPIFFNKTSFSLVCWKYSPLVFEYLSCISKEFDQDSRGFCNRCTFPQLSIFISNRIHSHSFRSYTLKSTFIHSFENRRSLITHSLFFIFIFYFLLSLSLSFLHSLFLYFFSKYSRSRCHSFSLPLPTTVILNLCIVIQRVRYSPPTLSYLPVRTSAIFRTLFYLLLSQWSSIPYIHNYPTGIACSLLHTAHSIVCLVQQVYHYFSLRPLTPYRCSSLSSQSYKQVHKKTLGKF